MNLHCGAPNSLATLGEPFSRKIRGLESVLKVYVCVSPTSEGPADSRVDSPAARYARYKSRYKDDIG